MRRGEARMGLWMLIGVVGLWEVFFWIFCFFYGVWICGLFVLVWLEKQKVLVGEKVGCLICQDDLGSLKFVQK